tara:strand:- start:61 stop:450 length:390 start_codon:yes stop_codon:yes gene_type:complete
VFSFLFKAGFYWKIFTFIKQWGFSFLILFISIFLISYIHSEYISWNEVSGKKLFLGYSYVLKNILILICVGIFLLINFFKLKQLKKVENIERSIDHTGSEKFKKLKAKRQSGELKTEYDRILEGSDDEK